MIPITRSIDSHVGGQAVRLAVEGFPAPRGRTMLDRRDWATRHADDIRRALIFEPRGHRDMLAAALTEAVSPGSHAGALFMTSAGYPAMSGTAVVALATVALERGLLMPGGDGCDIVLDTAAGVVRAHADLDRRDDGSLRVERVSYVNVPSFVIAPAVPVRVRGRILRADVAFGGGFYAILDAESAGLGVNPALAPELRRVGIEIVQAIGAAQTVAHPLEPRLAGIDGAIFTAPPSGDAADLRSVTVSADGAVDRSPGGNSTAAVMAVLSAMGLLNEGASFTHEGIAGATFTGRVATRTVIGEHEAIVAAIDATAWITGEHAFVVDETDPLAEGFLF